MSSDFTIIHKYLIQCSLRNAGTWVFDCEGSCLREVFACTPMLWGTAIMLFVKMIMLAVVLRWPCFLANSRCVRSGNEAALDPMVYSA